MDINKLQLILNEQYEFYKDKETGLVRKVNFEPFLKTNQITIISGVRRSGKSTLMLQFARQFEDFHFVNFDDERFVNFRVDDFQLLMTVLHQRSETKNIFFDEIQNIDNWERFIRRIHDQGYKIYLTGSNARLLSSELSTHLTGRYLKIELYPFSFVEFLNFRNIDFQNLTTQKIARILTCVDEYIDKGGFPELVKSGNIENLQRIYEDVIYRDIIVRYKIQEVKAFKELSQYLMTNISKEFTYQSVARNLSFKSQTSVKNYVDFLESVYMFFEHYKFDYSLKKQFVSNKKIYSIDNGLRNTIAFKFSSDKGRLLENLVFIELRRRQKEIFYYKNKNECDFIIQESGKITSVIQVCYQLDYENEKREISGLIEAAKLFKLKHSLIISYSEEENRIIDGISIKIIPVWKWLLEI
jgi:uncharacterized protein